MTGLAPNDSETCFVKPEEFFMTPKHKISPVLPPSITRFVIVDDFFHENP